MYDPIKEFNNHWQRALEHSSLKQKSAVCVSTIGRDGFPNSRFVDLKEADARGLIFCTSLSSSKGQDILQNPRTGLTAWWEHIGIQARFQGNCIQINDEEADKHWKARSRDAQLTSMTFQQSEPLDDPRTLHEKLELSRTLYARREIARPKTWGGFRLVPFFIEILNFKEDRLHVRTCYSLLDGEWQLSHLQP